MYGIDSERRCGECAGANRRKRARGNRRRRKGWEGESDGDGVRGRQPQLHRWPHSPHRHPRPSAPTPTSPSPPSLSTDDASPFEWMPAVVVHGTNPFPFLFFFLPWKNNSSATTTIRVLITQCIHLHRQNQWPPATCPPPVQISTCIFLPS